MTRRQQMHRYFCCVAVAIVATTASLLRADERPNIVVILADDMGYSDVGCYGGEVQTPNIDNLARQGVRFKQFYNCARCCPTRASLLTGAYPHRVGLANNGRTMSMEATTVAEYLQRAGYSTAMAGKWHLSELAHTTADQDRIGWMNHQVDLDIPFADPATYPTRRGFQRYYGVIWGVVDFFDPFSLTKGTEPVREVPDDYYITDAISDYAVRYVDEFAQDDSPFFLYVAYTAPHWPLHARAEDIARYQGMYDEGWDALRRQRFDRQVELGLFDEDTPLGDVIVPGKPWDQLTPEQKAFQAAKLEVHAAMVDRMDQGIGRIVEKLEQSGELDNTLLVFLSDNGASPEIPAGPGYDRNGQTRDGRRALRDRALQAEGNRSKLGSDESYTGIGAAWASATNTPLRYWKMESFEGGCRTPLVIHWPAGLNLAEGSLVDEVGHVIDFAPTFLDVAGAKPEGDFQLDGKSLAPLLRGEEHQAHDELYFAHEAGKGARQGDWKIATRGGNWQLFNLADDPGETNDLSSSESERRQAMIEAWEQWHRQVTTSQTGA